MEVALVVIVALVAGLGAAVVPVVVVVVVLLIAVVVAVSVLCSRRVPLRHLHRTVYFGSITAAFRGIVATAEIGFTKKKN